MMLIEFNWSVFTDTTPLTNAQRLALWRVKRAVCDMLEKTPAIADRGVVTSGEERSHTVSKYYRPDR